MEVAPGGGSNKPETDARAEAALFVVEGKLALALDGKHHEMVEGGYAFVPAGTRWSVRNEAGATVKFHWIRKSYE